VSGLYYMNSKGGEIRPIAIDSTVDVFYADISPDGAQVAYQVSRAVRNEIRVVSILGGSSRLISRLGILPRWRPDGQVIGYILSPIWSSSHKLEFWTVRPDGSDNTRVFADTADAVPNSSNWCSFAWSADGGHIAWLRN